MKSLADYVHSQGPEVRHLLVAGTMTCRSGPEPRPRGRGREDVRRVGHRLSQVRQLQQPGPTASSATRRWARRSPRRAGRSCSPSASGVRTSPGSGDGLWAAALADDGRHPRLLEVDAVDPRQAGRPGEILGPERMERSGHARGGQRRMTNAEYVAHFSLWALLNAPLIAGNDLGR